jgi:hypothetical protein
VAAAPSTAPTHPAGGTASASPHVSPASGESSLSSIIVTGPDAGAAPVVKVFDAATGTEKFEFLAYDSSFLGGVRVAAADMTGDGVPDIITVPGPGMPTEVKVFDGLTGAQIPGPRGDILAYGSFQGGAFVAVGDTNQDGIPDIITGPGAGGGSNVHVYSGRDGSLLRSFAAYGACPTDGNRCHFFAENR